MTAARSRARKPRLIGLNLVTLLLIAAAVAAVVIAMRRCGPAAPPPAAPAQPVSRLPGQTRIVTLSPALAIILRDLGYADLIVGRDAHDMVLDRSLPVCGDQAGLDYEAILQARPTHILMQAGASPVPPRLERMASEHGWTVKAYPLLTLDDIAAAVADLPKLIPERRPGAAAEGLGLRMDGAWRRRDIAGAGRVLLLESLDPPAAFGPGSFHQQILERIGGTPAITRGKPFITMDAEDVLRLAPDAIIIFAPRLPGAERGPAASPEQLRAAMGRLGTLDIPAVRAGRLAKIDHPLSLTPSTAMLEVAEEMVRILEGWSGPER